MRSFFSFNFKVLKSLLYKIPKDFPNFYMRRKKHQLFNILFLARFYMPAINKRTICSWEIKPAFHSG